MLSQVIVFLNLFYAVQRNQGEERIYIYPPHQYHFPFIFQVPLMPLSWDLLGHVHMTFGAD